MIADGVGLFVSCVEYALPIAVAFEVGNLICSTILRAAFGGGLWFRR